MGKKFAEEVQYIPQAIEWAFEQDIDFLERTLAGFSERSLVVIGSGGSTTAAAFLAQLHEAAFGQVSRSSTPGEFLAQGHVIENSAVVLVSAEGKNQDILATAERVTSLEIPCVGLVLAAHSPLALQCETQGATALISFPMPWKKDGYLATNSLVATLILLARVYQGAIVSELRGVDSMWLATRQKLIRDQGLVGYFQERKSLSVLFGKCGKIGAIDLESKLTEAAFGACGITDFRQFAHGRHLQLMDEERAPCFVVFSDEEEDVLCDSTLAFFPKNVPVVRLPLPSDPVIASVISVIDSILITNLLGQGLSRDPGQPFVSEAARGMHQLEVANLFARTRTDSPAIRRKIKPETSNVVVSDWLNAGNRFCEKLASAKIKALVCDFDGTFCNTESRFHGLDQRLIPAIEALARRGMTLAFASGRGDSLHKDLRSKLNPDVWGKIFIGYYSGSLIDSLDTSSVANPLPDLRLIELKEWLIDYGLVPSGDVSPIKMHGGQLSIRAFKGFAKNRMVAGIRYWLADQRLQGWRVYCSGHSIDVLAESASKNNVVSFIANRLGCDPLNEIVRMGDSGDFEGNDHELLDDGLGLSVDKVSSSRYGCWNLLPEGCRGVLGTRFYLEGLVQEAGEWSYSPMAVKEFYKSLAMEGSDA